MGTGWLLINWGWALGVFSGVLVSYKSGGHLNPAVTLGFLAAGNETYAAGVPVTAASTAVYLIAELVGALIGAGLSIWPTSSTSTLSPIRARSWASSPPVQRSATPCGT